MPTASGRHAGGVGVGVGGGVRVGGGVCVAVGADAPFVGGGVKVAVGTAVGISTVGVIACGRAQAESASTKMDNSRLKEGWYLILVLYYRPRAAARLTPPMPAARIPFVTTSPLLGQKMERLGEQALA